jgi:hypothetical protein
MCPATVKGGSQANLSLGKEFQVQRAVGQQQIFLKGVEVEKQVRVCVCRVVESWPER